MANSTPLTVKFWGVRGSIPCSGPDTAYYGGNSSCIELRCGERRLILDAGTGIRPLGNTMKAERDIDIFLSHCHYDHIIGLPFFQPIFRPGVTCRIWAGHLQDDGGIEKALSDMMSPPMFPITLDFLRANFEFRDFRAGETVALSNEIALRTAALNHPDGATGYRVEFAGKAVCYVTDTEHMPGEPDATILGLIEGADLLIYDSTYTDAEFPTHQGFGHSTWQEGMRLAEAAGVKTYAVFHHDPGHDDKFMHRVAAEAADARPGTIVARDGMELKL